jgi:hypothetical protein
MIIYSLHPGVNWTLKKLGKFGHFLSTTKKTGLTSSESTLHPFSIGFLLYLGYFKETKCRPKQNIQASKTLKLFSPDLPNQFKFTSSIVTMGIFFSAWHVASSSTYFRLHRPGIIWLLTGKFILSSLYCFFVPVLINIHFFWYWNLALKFKGFFYENRNEKCF